VASGHVNTATAEDLENQEHPDREDAHQQDQRTVTRRRRQVAVRVGVGVRRVRVGGVIAGRGVRRRRGLVGRRRLVRIGRIGLGRRRIVRGGGGRVALREQSGQRQRRQDDERQKSLLHY
jgi:hypothetical protein